MTLDLQTFMTFEYFSNFYFFISQENKYLSIDGFAFYC